MQQTAVFAVAGSLLLTLATGSVADIEYKADGWRLEFPGLGQSLDIAPLPCKSATHEAELKDGMPGWRGPLLLPGPAWVYGALRAETLEVIPVKDPQTKLTAGEDFLLDPAWAAVAAKPGSRWPAGTRLRFSYEYGLSRIDLVEQDPDGRLVLLEGTPHKGQPHRPQGTPGNRPLLAVYLPNYARSLTEGAKMLQIDPAYDGIPPVERTAKLAPLKAKLATDAPVTIVFFGDSITSQPPRDFQDGKGTFVERFKTWLGETWPERKVIATSLDQVVPLEKNQTLVVMSGVGGNDSRTALARLEKDVLAHNPDLVVTMFGANDENRAGTSENNVVPVAEYRANLATIVKQVREKGGEVLLMTPAMKNPDWIATVGNMAEYAAAMRELAAEADLPLVDAYRAWELLPARGYHPMVFLGNCINHPIDLGHDLFFRGLRSAFGGYAQPDGGKVTATVTLAFAETPTVPVVPAAVAAPAAAEEAVGPVACACQPDAKVGRVGEITIDEVESRQDCRVEDFLLHSPAMQRDIRVSVLLPPAWQTEPERQFPVLYALHGRGAPYKTWLAMSGLRRKLAEFPMVVVAFDCDINGWYIDAVETPRSLFTTFFFDELSPWVESTYRIAPGQRAATGFSMGGFGAFHYMLTKPDYFVSVSSLSSAFSYMGEQGAPNTRWVEPLLGSFEQYPERYAAYNILLRLDQAARDKVKLPPLFMGYGLEDHAYRTGLKVYEQLQHLGYQVSLREDSGGHNWAYWSKLGPHVIEFHGQVFADTKQE